MTQPGSCPQTLLEGGLGCCGVFFALCPRGGLATGGGGGQLVTSDGFTVSTWRTLLSLDYTFNQNKQTKV